MTWDRHEIAHRIAQDIPDGWVVNIGVGLPTLIPEHVPADREVLFQSENGILGMIPLPDGTAPDPNMIDAGKNPISVLPGGSFFDSSVSFSMIRGGHIDLGVVGALQISQTGDIANWKTNSKMIGGIGGAADVCSGVKRLWVAMQHLDKKGGHKLLTECTFPLTAAAVVERVYTDFVVLERMGQRWKVVDLAPGIGFTQVQESTGFPVIERV